MSDLVKTLMATAPHYQCSKLLNEAADLIEQLQREREELAATVERLRFISETEYADEDERIADIHGALEATPQDNLNAIKREAFIVGYLDAITDCGNPDENLEEAEFRAEYKYPTEGE